MMRNGHLLHGLFILVAAAAISGCSARVEPMRWAELPPLPAGAEQDEQIGVAGPFAGVSGGALLVGGGANFPEAAPWDGGRKVWWDDVFVLERGGDGTFRWTTGSRFKLPGPLAYGVSITTDAGVVCIGGCDAERCYRDVFLLTWDPARRQIEVEAWPPLPAPLAFAAGARVGEAIFVAGGLETMKDGRATRRFEMLDLSRRGTDAFEWQTLGPWPGPARMLPVAAGQSNGEADCFYLFSGRTAEPDVPTMPLTDAWCYVPARRAWRRLADVAPAGEPARSVTAGVAVAWDPYRVIVIGGDDGVLFCELERLEQQIQRMTHSAEADALEARRRAMLEQHPGFRREILAYDTLTDRWTAAGLFPAAAPVTTAAAEWGGSIVITSGEIRPGVRTPKLWRARIHDP
jgi:cyclically-permuted mutarotase family protein